jgi:hypothetical protein
MASRRLDELIRIYGPRPDLRLHKVVTDLNVPRQTRSSLAEMVAAGGERPTLLDELSARLNERLLPAARRQSVKFALVDEDVAATLNLIDPPGGEPLAPGDVGGLRAYVYVEDEPSLNNLDWSFSPQRTLEEAVSGRFQSRVIRLPRGDVARFRPTVIYDSAEGRTFRAVDTAGKGGGLLQPRYFIGNRNPGRFGGGGGGGGRFLPRFYVPVAPCFDDDDDKDDRRRAEEDDDDCDDDDRDTDIVIVRR